MKTYHLILMSIFIFTSACDAQIKNAKIETVNIAGNCGMCETTIEKAGSKKKIYKTSWNVDTKTAEISYDPAKTDLDHILKQIALAGYDNERFVAPDEAYNNLHGCCQYARDQKSTASKVSVKTNDAKVTDHANHMPDNSKKEVEQDKNQISPILEKYYELKDALVKSNGSAASTKSAELMKELEAVKMEALNHEVHKVWMKYEKNLKEDAEHIAGTKALDHQRDHFATLSKNMYELVKVSKPEGTIYYEHCPMYNDNKGANWISKEKAIKNPYYGSKMLTCGKVIEKVN